MVGVNVGADVSVRVGTNVAVGEIISVGKSGMVVAVIIKGVEVGGGSALALFNKKGIAATAMVVIAPMIAMTTFWSIFDPFVPSSGVVFFFAI